MVPSLDEIKRINCVPTNLKLRVVSAEQLAMVLDVRPATIFRWVKEGSFPSPLRIGPRVFRWPLADVIKHFKACGVDTTDADAALASMEAAKAADTPDHVPSL